MQPFKNSKQNTRLEAAGPIRLARSPRRSIPAAALLACLIAFSAAGLWAKPGRVLAQPNAATITLESSAAAIQGCQEVVLDVWVNDVTGLYGADVEVSFDPSLMEVVDADTLTPGVQVIRGPLLQDPLFIVRDTADNSLGTMRFAATQLNPAPEVNGSGILFSARLRGKSGGTSALHFSLASLGGRGGVGISASAVDGSLEAAPPVAPSISAAGLNASDLRLSWTASTGVAGYDLFRSTQPYFTPAGPAYQSTTSLSYDDLGALGSTVSDYFYVVQSTCSNGFRSQISNRAGEFDYTLYPDKYSFVGVPLLDSGLAVADDLAVRAGSPVVWRWVESSQSYDIRIANPIGVGVNFPLATGEAYMVLTSTGSPSVFTTWGGVPAPGSVQFNIARQAACQWNLLTLPLDQPALNLADLLATSIGGVPVIGEWRAETSSYDLRIGGLIGVNFTTRIGYPYWPCADNSGTNLVWP